MTELEAYPCGRTYDQRNAQRYQPGDLVTIGPGYNMAWGGRAAYYSHDGKSGVMEVVRRTEGDTANFYDLKYIDSPYSWDLNCVAARLTLHTPSKG